MQPAVSTNASRLIPKWRMGKKEHIGDRIGRALDENPKELSVAGLAAACKVSVQAVYNKWIKLGQVSKRHLPTIAGYLRKSMDVLLTGDEGTGDGKYLYVTKISGSKIAGGKGDPVFSHEEIDQSHAFKTEWLRKKGYKQNKLRLIEVTGLSMLPTFEPGDVVLVNFDDTAVRSGKVYAIAAGDGPRIKRLYQRSDGGLEIRSDNQSPEFPVEVVRPGSESEVQIIGRVVWSGGEH